MFLSFIVNNPRNSLFRFSHMHMFFSLKHLIFRMFENMNIESHAREKRRKRTMNYSFFHLTDMLIICRRLKSSSLLQEQHIQVADGNSFASSTNNRTMKIEREKKKRNSCFHSSISLFTKINGLTIFIETNSQMFD